MGEQDLDVTGLAAQDALQQGVIYLLLVSLMATDALDVAEACLDQALADARLRASIPAQGFVLEFRGMTFLRRGAVARAES